MKICIGGKLLVVKLGFSVLLQLGYLPECCSFFLKKQRSDRGKNVIMSQVFSLTVRA
jgi:hypothetical protein